MKRKCGETFLTKPRWETYDVEKADKSFFVWGEKKIALMTWDTEEFLREGKKYQLSLLGVLNGFLTKVGLVFVVDVEKDTGIILKHRLMRKWWK